ncbi:MAG: hypothetical protein AAF938_29740 [Myxococcota bacterium]
MNTRAAVFLFLLSCLGFACGGDSLTARGEFSLQLSDSREGFTFPQDVTLGEGEVPDGAFRGFCTFAGDGARISIENPQGEGLRRVGVAVADLRPEATTAQVDAEVRDDRYSGACDIDVLYAFRGESFGFRLDCELDSGSATGRATSELHFNGCDSE